MKIKKIISLCPALPDWRAVYKNKETQKEVWVTVAAWALVKIENEDDYAEQMIVPITSGHTPSETMDMILWEIRNCLRVEFMGDLK
jgi:hypothetical protein